MNDFAIQGVTILGTEPEKGLSLFALLVILFLLFSGAVSLILIISWATKSSESFVITLISFAFLCLLVYAAGERTRSCIEPLSTMYTVSIDDTASYNEIKNNFYYIRELPNGLYEVKLTENNSQND